MLQFYIISCKVSVVFSLELLTVYPDCERQLRYGLVDLSVFYIFPGKMGGISIPIECRVNDICATRKVTLAKWLILHSLIYGHCCTKIQYIMYYLSKHAIIIQTQVSKYLNIHKQTADKLQIYH